MGRYLGFTKWETWETILYLEEYLRENLKLFKTEKTTENEKIDMLYELTEEILKYNEEEPGFKQDILFNYISNVNFEEILEILKEE